MLSSMNDNLKSSENESKGPGRPVGDPGSPSAEQYNKSREILRLTILGEKPSVIAASVGLSEERVRAITRSPIFREHQKTIQDRLDILYTVNVGDSFKRRAGEAADTIYNTMQKSECEKLKVTCAQDILDRAGYKAPEKFVVEQRPVLAQADLDAISDATKKEDA